MENPRELEGEWNFTGHYPQNCKPMPDCHTKRMNLELKGEDKRRYLFSTKATMTGDACPIEARSYNKIGVTQVKENKILFGDSSIHKLGFNWISKPYYIDKDEKREKLFIKEKGGQ